MSPDRLARPEHAPDEPLLDGDEEPWLVSYADLMTLLFGFFVLMFSFTSFDQDEMKKVSKSLSAAFSARADRARTQGLAESVKKALAGRSLAKDISVVETDTGLEVTLTSSLLFESGRSELFPAAERPLTAFIASVVKNAKSTGEWPKVIVEGHTDDQPISTPAFRSNWELSSARAATVVHFFEAAAFPPDHLEAVGFGSTHPILPNRDEAGAAIPENQARNRRVLIRVVASG